MNWADVKMYIERPPQGPRKICSHFWVSSFWNWHPRQEAYGPILRAWLEQCEQDHPDCASVATTNVRLPTRVIYVECDKTGGADRVRLHISLENEVGCYIALSRCWGGIVPLKTTKQDLKDYTSGGILFSSLPATFQDAILVTRGIGVDYVWIDSLCILQDDTFDWEIESSKIAAIYRNAKLVIEASDSSDSNQGFIQTDPRFDHLLDVEFPIVGTITNDDGSISNLRAEFHGIRFHEKSTTARTKLKQQIFLENRSSLTAQGMDTAGTGPRHMLRTFHCL